MTEEQDVLNPRRQARRTPVILLGILPAAIGATLLVAGPNYSAPVTTSEAAGAAKVVAQRAQITPGVVAPAASVDLKSGVQTIVVTVPKPKVKAVAPVTVAYRTAASGGLSTASLTTKYKRFCANPSNPVSTSSTTGKALLTLVNKERAKIGARKLTWSTSLASAAGKWSRTMLARDLKTSKLIDGLAHNPNRPGAENVAVVYRSTGYAASTAISRMHKNLVYSPGHCLNLMNPKFKTMGSGVAGSKNKTTWYATENFR